MAQSHLRRDNTMRFQKGFGYPDPRPPRGPGRGDPPYRMSRRAYQSRLRNLGGVARQHSYGETRCLELEIALGTHRGETYRAMAERLGLRSHAHCWRVAHRYRTRQIPMLPSDEQGLVALRDSLGHGRVPLTAKPPAREPDLPTPISGATVQPSLSPCTPLPGIMTADEMVAERWREVAEWKRKNQPCYDTRRRISVPIPR
jgi:hypothetical protein